MKLEPIAIVLELALFPGSGSLVHGIRLLILLMGVLVTLDLIMNVQIFLKVLLDKIFLLDLLIVFHKEVILDPISEPVHYHGYKHHDKQ